jgi:hypothetical protein
MKKKTKFLTFNEVKKLYNHIKYKATTTGLWYLLKDYFPICIECKKNKYSVYLDTGGEMTNGYFNVYQLTKTELFLNGKKITDIKLK